MGVDVRVAKYDVGPVRHYLLHAYLDGGHVGEAELEIQDLEGIYNGARETRRVCDMPRIFVPPEWRRNENRIGSRLLEEAKRIAEMERCDSSQTTKAPHTEPYAEFDGIVGRFGFQVL